MFEKILYPTDFCHQKGGSKPLNNPASNISFLDSPQVNLFRRVFDKKTQTRRAVSNGSG